LAAELSVYPFASLQSQLADRTNYQEELKVMTLKILAAAMAIMVLFSATRVAVDLELDSKVTIADVLPSAQIIVNRP
jgi:hypothetical protein